jgi:hypothetical protein
MILLSVNSKELAVGISLDKDYINELMNKNNNVYYFKKAA